VELVVLALIVRGYFFSDYVFAQETDQLRNALLIIAAALLAPSEPGPARASSSAHGWPEDRRRHRLGAGAKKPVGSSGTPNACRAGQIS
jgi:hypothetical protein